MKQCVVAFGSNVGDRESNIADALSRLATAHRLVAVSGLYETAPLYKTDQGHFLNGVALIETETDAGGLLNRLKEIEHLTGRQVRERNGPREIDLDIVWMEDYVSPPGDVPVVPHPRAHERRFVLEPLNELDSGLVLQGYGVVKELLAQPGVQSQTVRRIGDAPVPIPRP